MSQPLGKASKLLVLDEINKKAETLQQLDFDLVAFGTPVVNSNTQYDRNTQMRVSSITDKLVGARDVWYNRLDLTELFRRSNITTVELSKPEPFNNVTDLLAEINSTYGLALDASDIVSTAPVDGDVQTLVAKADSYAWLGELKVTLLGDAPEKDLSEIIKVNVLDGLRYPDADVTGISPIVSNMGQLEGAMSSGTSFNTALLANTPASNVWHTTNGEIQVAVTAADATTAVVPEHRVYKSSNPLTVVASLYVPNASGTVKELFEKYDLVLFHSAGDVTPTTLRLVYDADTNKVSATDETGQPVTGAEFDNTSNNGTLGIKFGVRANAPKGEYGVVAQRKNSLVARVANIIKTEIA